MQAKNVAIEAEDESVVSISEQGMAQRVSNVLIDKVRHSIGSDRYGLDGRLIDWTSTLLGMLEVDRLGQLGSVGDRSKFREPQSGASIALNSFLQWQVQPELLQIAGLDGFSELRFGGRCPTGIRGTPPHLDLIAAGGNQIVAVTARGLDYLKKPRAKLAQAYLEMPPVRGLQPWRDLAGRIGSDKADGEISFAHLDAAALVKFAYGIGRTFPNHEITLIYLYWEPQGGSAVCPFIDHRRELATVEHFVEGASVQFKSQCFHQLWQSWLKRDEPFWVRELVAQLEQRFSVALAS